MNNILVLDTDAASVIAKAEIVDELLKLYSEVKIVITPKVQNELEVPLEYGYEFPERILSRIDTVTLSKSEKDLYWGWLDNLMIGKGELESIAVAKIRKGTFFTMDRTAARFAKSKSVDIVAFDKVMKEMLKKNIMDRKEAEKAITKIEERDNRIIDADRIFVTYE